SRCKHEPFRDDILYPNRFPWIARLRRAHRITSPAGIGDRRGLEKAALAGARCHWALLALCRRGLGLCFVRGLHPASTPMSTEQFFLTAWTWNPLVLTISGVGLAAYLFAFGAQGRPTWFLLALSVFVLTLVSPLNALASG